MTNGNYDEQITKMLTGLYAILDDKETNQTTTAVVCSAILAYFTHKELIDELRAIRKALEISHAL